MTTPPPEHSGIRPLGPYGEGYCRVCRFVVGLTADHLLEEHWRGKYANLGDGKACKGSYTRPPKVTPYASRKSAFRATATKVICPVCRREVVVMADGRLNVHTVSYHRLAYCEAGWHTYEAAQSLVRDHQSERGSPRSDGNERG